MFLVARTMKRQGTRKITDDGNAPGWHRQATGYDAHQAVIGVSVGRAAGRPKRDQGYTGFEAVRAGKGRAKAGRKQGGRTML